jgi:uncharacterized protein with PQ loop repeat
MYNVCERIYLVILYNITNIIHYNMSFAHSVSILAPIVNCIQLFPQLYKTYQTKHVEDLSLYSLFLLLLTSTLWLFHGYFIQDTSLMVAGIISVTVNVTLLFLFFKYHRF